MRERFLRIGWMFLNAEETGGFVWDSCYSPIIHGACCEGSQKRKSQETLHFGFVAIPAASRVSGSIGGNTDW